MKNLARKLDQLAAERDAKIQAQEEAERLFKLDQLAAERDAQIQGRELAERLFGETPVQDLAVVSGGEESRAMEDCQHQGIPRVDSGAPLLLLSYRAQPGRRASLSLACKVSTGCVQAGSENPSLSLHPLPPLTLLSSPRSLDRRHALVVMVLQRFHHPGGVLQAFPHSRFSQKLTRIVARNTFL